MRSFFRAAGVKLILTLDEPFVIIPGPPGTQGGSMQGLLWSMTRAAALLSIFTFGEHGGMIANGSAGCGTGVGTGAAGWIGA